ncbi:MAG: acyltransferase [Planctomycetota bacterium]|nr:acyltransferase [Planctomycetota bacterium]
MKAVREVGWRRVLLRVWWAGVIGVFRLLPTPPLRKAWMKIFGARLGRNTIVERVRFLNADRGGFASLSTGDSVFLGDDVLIDLARGVVIGDHVTIAARANLITHLNVGYSDHPLQGAFPAREQPVVIGTGSFIGIGSTILPGVKIGEESFVAAGAVVDKDVPPRRLVAGVPAKVIREIELLPE